jgi:hypothetical protein
MTRRFVHNNDLQEIFREYALRGFELMTIGKVLDCGNAGESFGAGRGSDCLSGGEYSSSGASPVGLGSQGGLNKNSESHGTLP